jgi:hypothetical protein
MLLAAALAAASAAACQPDTTRREGPAFGRDAAAFTPKGWDRESLNDPDLNRDGTPDLLLVVRDGDQERRRLIAAVATPRGFRNVGEAALPGYPVGGGAHIEFNARGVLFVTDLTGGTTANQTVMRYRYEGPSALQGAMRLIGLDIGNYSRTNQHDSLDLSFNYLTGDWSRQLNKLTKRGDYAPQRPVRGKGEAACKFMEDTADPDDIISAEVPHGDRE